MKTKMNTKKLLVSFVLLASLLLLVGSVSAADFSSVEVTVDSIDAGDNAALIAGDASTIKVFFDSDIDASDVKVKVEIDGHRVSVDESTVPFEVESGHRYVKILTLRVPNELEDEVSDDATLDVKIWGGNSLPFTDSFNVRIQRPSYNVDFMSIGTTDSVEAGKIFPVNVVIKNVGYNKLNDLYITAKIPALGVQKTGYFGDLISIEDDDNNDFVTGKLFLDIPFSAKNGVYSLEVSAKSDDFSTNEVKQILIENGLSSNVFASGNKIVLVNPNTQPLVLKLVPESDGKALITLSEDLVVIPAGASRTVTASSNGEDYKVNIFSKNGELLDTVTLSGNAYSGNGNAIAVLTVILTIIFLVLVVVLIVLVTKKPEKTEEFSESYY